MADKGTNTVFLPDRTEQEVKGNEKLKKLQEMQAKVKHLREERFAKHAARVEMLKKMNVERYSIKTSQNLSISNNGQHSKLSLSSKSWTPAHKSTIVINKTLPVKDMKLKNDQILKTESFVRSKDKYKNIETKVDCRRCPAPVPNQVNNTKRSSTATVSKYLANKSAFNNITKVDCRRCPAPVPNQVNNTKRWSTATVSKYLANNNKSALNNITIARTAPGISFDIKTKTSGVDKTKTLAGQKILQSAVYKTTGRRDEAPKTNHLKIIGDCKIIPTVRNKISSTIDRLSKPKILPKTSIVIQRPEKRAIPKDRKGMKVAANKQDVSRNKLIRKTIHVEKSAQNDMEKSSEFQEKARMRRSLSTVHFKRLGSEAAKKCTVRRTFSVGNLKNGEIEDEVSSVFPFKQYTLPVESERKKSVKFLTPLRKSNSPMLFLNTPKASELKNRLNQWLNKRGKSISSYHHLHCFGIHHSDPGKKGVLPTEQVNDENKENEEVYMDDSFEELTTGVVKDNAAEWRRGSYTLAESPVIHSVTGNNQEIRAYIPPISESTSIGALEDLQQLILEGYSWKQCAEWLEAIVRHCGDVITKTASYWECRAALEDGRGDFSRAVECYNKAILQGAEPTEVEASLDQLLQKFMKLNLDPGKRISQATDPKFLDIKNVFKSTLIRFAIQQKGIAESKEAPGNLISKYVATPVRRSSRLSQVPGSVKNNIKTRHETPKVNGTHKGEINENSVNRKCVKRSHLVQLCNTLQNVDGDIRSNLVFVPNKALNFNNL